MDTIWAIKLQKLNFQNVPFFCATLYLRCFLHVIPKHRFRFILFLLPAKPISSVAKYNKTQLHCNGCINFHCVHSKINAKNCWKLHSWNSGRITTVHDFPLFICSSTGWQSCKTSFDYCCPKTPTFKKLVYLIKHVSRWRQSCQHTNQNQNILSSFSFFNILASI